MTDKRILLKDFFRGCRFNYIIIINKKKPLSDVFCFDKEWQSTNFIAERGRSSDGDQLVLTKWSTPISEHRMYSNGLRLPSKGEAVWNLDSGKYSYIKLEIIDVEYDTPSLY